MTPISYPEAEQIAQIIGDAHKIVIVQADNPDGDSLGSALALEHTLGDLGKEPFLYCGVDTPTYLRYMRGWDRIETELPKDFDASIIVDASTMTLLEQLTLHSYDKRLAAKPCIVLDHHGTVEQVVPFATTMINDPSVASAGEVIFHLGKQLGWPLNNEAAECLMTSILGDTQGLTNQLTKASTYQVMAALVEAGADRPALEELRREYSKMPQAIFKYKAMLINHTEFADDGRIATVVVPQDEINTYSPLYNPGPLVQNDLLQTQGVAVAIVFKKYDDGKITGAIRCNVGFPVGAKLADSLGGGGHDYAAGFKVTDGRPFNEVKSECIATAIQLLNSL